MFFAIAGALMLEKNEEPLKKVWVHKIGRIAIALIFWSFFYYVVEIIQGTGTFNFREFFKVFCTSYWNYSFWYLFAYIPMLMTLPILQKFAKALSTKDYGYMLALVIVFSMVKPVGEYLLWHDKFVLNSKFNIDWMCATIFIYPCIGYFLYHRLQNIWNKKNLVLLWIVNIVTIVLSCYLTYADAQWTGVLEEGTSQRFLATFSLINCIAVFVTCQYAVKKIIVPAWLEKVICSLGSCTFGIYLLHVFYKGKVQAVQKLWDVFRIQCGFNDMLSAMLYCGVVFMLGYVTTLLIKKIPIIGKIIV